MLITILFNQIISRAFVHGLIYSLFDFPKSSTTKHPFDISPFSLSPNRTLQSYLWSYSFFPFPKSSTSKHPLDILLFPFLQIERFKATFGHTPFSAISNRVPKLLINKMPFTNSALFMDFCNWLSGIKVYEDYLIGATDNFLAGYYL